MDVLLRGLCELQIDEMLDKSMIQEYSGLLMELGIPDESRSCFLRGYIAGSARSRLNASSLAMSNRPLNEGEIEVFSEVLGRRMDEILGKVLDQGIEKRAKEGALRSLDPRLVAITRKSPPTKRGARRFRSGRWQQSGTWKSKRGNSVSRYQGRRNPPPRYSVFQSTLKE